jgi:signal transduction histidine kinase
MRRINFIGYILRFRYLRLLLLSMLLPMLFVGFCLYYLIFNILAEQLGIPEVIAAHLLPVIHKINSILLIGLPPILLLLVIWGFILSSRLAGPISRIERELEEIIAKSNYSKRLKVRDKDDLKKIVDHINALLENLEEEKR